MDENGKALRDVMAPIATAGSALTASLAVTGEPGLAIATGVVSAGGMLVSLYSQQVVDSFKPKR